MAKQILEGIKVLDFGTMFAAPMAATYLAEFGADVIHVEHTSGDAARQSQPRLDGVSLINKVLGRNKKLITLDFHHQEAIDLFYDLVKEADVVITNYRPQALKKFHLDYEDLIKVNPQVIMLSLTAYGRTGPYSDRPGYDRLSQAYAGLTYFTGWPDRAPTLAGNWICDGIGGISSAYSVMLALYHKKCTGEGQLIDLALYDPLLRMMEDFVVDYSVTGNIKERIGNLNSSTAPNNMYRTKDGKWMIVLGNPQMWGRLCMAMDRLDLDEDPKFHTNDARMANRDEIDQIVADWCASMTMKELDEVLLKYDVAHGPVNSVEDIFNDPQIKARESLIKVFDPELNREITVQNIVPKMSKTPGKLNWTGGPIGADNDEIFLDVLKLTPERYNELKEKGAI